ncbi:hypothetical protein AB0D11_02420 [Streptomyces monashensis]|uniref:hypothetical protein n=1 Tax=Streptomyces monashensis TaxID=1678012 RepID=UPI0033CAF109
MGELGQFLHPATTVALAALLLTGCSSGTHGISSHAQAVGEAITGCRDFAADNQMFDHLDPGRVHAYLSDVRDSTVALQRAADLDKDWVPLAHNARIVIDALRRADAAVDTGRDPVWTEDPTIGMAALTVRAECARARSGGVSG